MVTINHLNLDKLTISTPEIVQSFQQNGSFNCSFWSAHELKTLACHIIETNTQSKKVDRFFKDLRVLRFSDEKKAVDLYALLAKDGRFDFLLPSMAEELASRVEQVAKEILDDSQVSDKPFQASLMPKNPALSDFANRVLNSIEVLVSTIDILINRGEFEEAIGLIKKMPQSPNKARVCESYLRANTSLNGEQIQELFTISGEDSNFAREIFYYYLRQNNPDAASVFMWVASSSYGSDFPDELRNKYLEVGDLEKAEALTFVCNPFNRNYLLIALFKAYVLKKETDPSINLSSIAKRITAGAQPDFKPDEFLKDLQSNVKTTEEFDKITPVYRYQYNRDCATLESIAKHLKSDQLQTAIDLISQIKSSIKKDQANLTLIKHLLEKNRIEEAKARLDFIKSPDTKGDAYLLILICL